MSRWLRSGYTKNFLTGIKKLHRCSSLFYMAPPAGLEPATQWLTVIMSVIYQTIPYGGIWCTLVMFGGI